MTVKLVSHSVTHLSLK